MSIFSSNSKDSKPEAPGQPASRPVQQPTSTTPSPSMSRSASSTILAHGTQIDGNVKIEGDIQIEGVVKGTLTSKGKVVIGNTGHVDGDVLCQHAEISGKVTGKLKIVDILFLKSSAKVDGDIHTGKLVMESGVKFNGNCSMGTAATVPASAPSTPAASSASSVASAGSASGTTSTSNAG